MRIRYPKSFFKLLFAGFVLAVLPLVAGLVFNTVAMQRLSTQSQRAVWDAARIAHATRDLSESATGLERAALQSTVLKDEVLWEGYHGLHKRFVEAADTLAGYPLEAGMRARLLSLRQLEEGIFESVDTLGLQSSLAPVTARRYAEVSAGARELVTSSGSMIDREIESMRELAAETETQVKRQLFLLVPVVVFVVGGFTYLLAKPIAQLEQGIRDLGERRLGTKVEVHGPADLEQLGDLLDWLRLRMIQLEEQQSRFLRHMSHELKTPLSALREGSDLLAEGVAGPLSPRQAEIVRILRQHSLELQRLIENLLRHGQTEFQQSAIKLQPVRPAEIVSQVAEKQKLAMAARQLQMEHRLEDFVMRTDVERLSVILDNLVSNAIRFSPAGGIIGLNVRKNGTQALFEVIDQGPGVAAEDREHIFEPFYRGNAKAGGAVKGSGLGLSITMEHVLALGGEISVGSGRGQFIVKLPLAA